jgi:ABC-type sugar transport system substrate-binding protein
VNQRLGQQVGEFVLEERLGRGGMAMVYRAVQPAMQRQVALKIITLDSGLAHEEEFYRRFAQEAEIIARLEHIHILPIYDYGVSDNMAYIAMRLLRGGTLAERLENGPLPLDQAADICTQVARGLTYAHSQGVIHRDIKPSNVMFDDAGNAYLADFGLAKITEYAEDLTKTGNVVGTPAYVAPEQLRAETVDHRADIYSLGVVLYHMLAGRAPFEMNETGVLGLIYRQAEIEPPPLRSLNPAVPPAVEMVVMRALRKDPNQRYSSADALADDLNAALGRKLSTDSLTAVPALRPTPVWRKPVFWLGALALLLVIGAGTVYLVQNSRPPTAAVVLAGARGGIEDTVLLDGEINQAAGQLGESGFIAYLACTLESEFQASRAREMKDLAVGYGIRLEVYDGGMDAYKQSIQLEQARTEGAKAFILCPLDSESIGPSLESLQEADIPLVSHIPLPRSYGGVMMYPDNREIGLQIGQFVGELIEEERGGEARVLILDYPLLSASVERADALEEGVLQTAPNATIVGRWPGGATRNEGYATMSELIEDGVEFDVVMTLSDASAFGAIQAMEEAGYAPDSVIVTGVNGETLAKNYIRDGYFMRASFELDRRTISVGSVNAVLRLLAGATLPEHILIEPGELLTRKKGLPAESTEMVVSAGA